MLIILNGELDRLQFEFQKRKLMDAQTKQFIAFIWSHLSFYRDVKR